MGMKERIAKQRLEGYEGHLLAICDLVDIPILFDSVQFVINADIERQKLGIEKFDIAIIAHSSDPVRINLKKRTLDNYKDHIYNFVIEATRLFDSMGSVLFFDNRKLFMEFFSTFKDNYSAIFPSNYNPQVPDLWTKKVYWKKDLALIIKGNEYLNIRASNANKRLIKSWLIKNVYPQVPISITLRFREDSKRNMDFNMREWQRLVSHYAEAEPNIKFVVLEDYYCLYEREDALKGNNVIYFGEPSVFHPLRVALYETCPLNLFCLSGAVTLAIFDKNVNYIMFKALPEVINPTYGMKPGSNFCGATKYQKFIWEQDNFEVMRNAVDNMLGVLRKDSLIK